MAELAFASACHLAGLIQRRQLGCLELLDHFIARVERLDSRLNAVVVHDFGKRHRCTFYRQRNRMLSKTPPRTAPKSR